MIALEGLLDIRPAHRLGRVEIDFSTVVKSSEAVILDLTDVEVLTSSLYHWE